MIKLERTPVNFLDADAIKAIGKITFVPGLATKRFAQQIQGAKDLTWAQRKYLYGIVVKFIKSVPDVKLVDACREALAREFGE